MVRAIVCGAGAAGLASAACLKRAGVEPVVLERGEAVGMSCRRRYPALRLNTLGWMSSLPGYRAGRRRYGEFPTRDDWVRYLEDYARHHELEIEFGVEVTRIERTNGDLRVTTAAGSREAPFVVVSTGFDHDPVIPDWPGRDGFQGELIHAADYGDGCSAKVSGQLRQFRFEAGRVARAAKRRPRARSHFHAGEPARSS